MSDALRDPYGHGLRLDRAHFDAALRQASIEAGSQWLQTNVCDLKKDYDGWTIQCESGLAIRASTVIDATGRSARLLRCLGQPRRRGTPLVALYQVARPEKNAAMERTLIEALPDGWIYAGKLADKTWAVGYHVQPKDAVRLRACDVQRAHVLAKAPYLNACLGTLKWTGPLVVRDARSLTAAAVCGPGWFAVGDAALALDPLAGQGLFNALRTGLAAAKAILLGSRAGEAAYAEELAQVSAIYFQRRKALYDAERRWLENDFWRGQRG